MDQELEEVQSLYERIGGKPAIEASVDLFYQKVLADESVAHFFVGIPMDRLKKHQETFLTFAFGGPNDYTGRSMRGAHKKLVVEHGLVESHYDTVVQHLADTLKELGVADNLIAEVAIIAGAVKVDVLNL